MVPLVIWQIVLGISFFPDDFIALFMNDFYEHDGAAGDHPPQRCSTPDSIRSCGDAPRTPIEPATVTEDYNSLEYIQPL
ncbi:unnamed protein product [Gongylonema pulchrum]|uniref:Anoctamin n=1 Tax=Gongylonema pulchrum TaxID=637853 RepID=A0A183DCQ2_9BILA|nr:unnamed protein product [Gongylonema pulchrum]